MVDNNISNSKIVTADYIFNPHTKNITVNASSQKGCPMTCSFCVCNNLEYKGDYTKEEIVTEISKIILESQLKQLRQFNIRFSKMGEPTFNKNVILAVKDIAEMYIMSNHYKVDNFYAMISTMMPRDNINLEKFLKEWIEAGYKYSGEDGFGIQFSINTLNEYERNKMFNNSSLTLQEISKIIDRLPAPRKRKYILNFAVTSHSNLNPNLMNNYFDKDKCIIKITPMKRIYTVENNDINNMEICEKFRRTLINDGWDTVIF